MLKSPSIAFIRILYINVLADVLEDSHCSCGHFEMRVTCVGLSVQKLWAFSDAPASLALMIVCLTHSLTDWSKLEIGNFACLTVLAPPLSYSIRWEYLSDQSGHPGGSGHNLHNLNFAKFSILSSASLDGFSVLFKIYFIGDTLPLACLWREVGMGRYHNIITLLLPKSWLHNQSRLFPTFSLFPLFRLSSSNVYYTMPRPNLKVKT